jgi:hypothetical protein
MPRTVRQGRRGLLYSVDPSGDGQDQDIPGLDTVLDRRMLLGVAVVHCIDRYGIQWEVVFRQCVAWLNNHLLLGGVLRVNNQGVERTIDDRQVAIVNRLSDASTWNSQDERDRSGNQSCGGWP